jgi:hypothetical protein
MCCLLLAAETWCYRRIHSIIVVNMGPVPLICPNLDFNNNMNYALEASLFLAVVSQPSQLLYSSRA